MKTVSVVIPFKDQQVIDNLNLGVDSLLSQTTLPFEVILVGPLDSPYVLNQNENKIFKKIVKLEQFNGDKNGARNYGISRSKGEYILYLDHDMVCDKNLIENCLSLSDIYDAIIIVEKSASGNFLQNCKKLEKELISYDIHTVTPRFYKKKLFTKDEKPFDERFGLLDEWGFNTKLSQKKARIGYSTSYVTIKDDNLNLGLEIRNKFKRGLWMKNFYKINKQEAWMRTNPIQRGIIFYSKRIYFLFKEPIYFPALVVLKFIDFIAFMSGYLLGYIIKPER